MAVKILKNKEFQKEVLECKTPILVDFYADWCGPCKMLAPVLEQVSTEMGEKVKVVKINVDDAEDIARKYRVMSIPTMVLIKNGEEQDRFIGLHNLQMLVDKINENL